MLMGALTHQLVMRNWCKHKVMPLAPVDDWWKCRRAPMWYDASQMMKIKSNRHWNGNNLSDILCSSRGVHGSSRTQVHTFYCHSFEDRISTRKGSFMDATARRRNAVIVAFSSSASMVGQY